MVQEWSIFMESKDTDTIRGLIIKLETKLCRKEEQGYECAKYGLCSKVRSK